MQIDQNTLVAYLTGDASDEEYRAVEEWRAADPKNEAEFRRRRVLWKLLGQLSWDERLEVVTATVGRDAEAAPQILPSKRRHRSQKRGSRRLRVPVWGMSAAAALLVGVLGTLASLKGASDGVAAGEVITGIGEIATVTLEDGTVVRLRGESRLEFNPGLGPRDVFLDGQAYFAVPGGREHRFRVHTERGQVTVLGTRFDVQSRRGDVRVVVVQGEVEMGVGDDRVSVRAHEGVRLENGADPVVEPIEDVYEATGWIGAFIAYEATPLAEVAQEFERRFGMEIQIAATELTTRTLTGWFASQSPTEMFDNICLAVDARCEMVGDTLMMGLPADGEVTGVR